MFTTNCLIHSLRSEVRLGPLSYFIPDCDGPTPKAAKKKKPGLSVCQTYAGAAIHADDLRITAESKDAVSQQANVICNFAKTANLKLNASKLGLNDNTRTKKN